jgi:hypothetical protein
MEEHIELLKERYLPVPEINRHATVTIQNETQNRSAALL